MQKEAQPRPSGEITGRKDRLKAWAFPLTAIIISLIASILYGIHWGWLDDVFYANNFAAIYTPRPIYDPNYFIGIRTILIYLYKAFPQTGWLGYFLTSLVSVTYLLFVYILHLHVRTLKLRVLTRVGLGFIVAFLFLPFFTRLNFTTISCLSTGIGMLALLYSEKNRILVTSLLIIFAGLMIRWHTSLPFLAMWTAAIVYTGYLHKNRRFSLGLRWAMVLTVYVNVWFFSHVSHNSDAQNFEKTYKKYEWIIQDGHIYPNAAYGDGYPDELSLPTTQDSLIYEAIYSWNTHDAEVINDEYYESIISQFDWGPKALIGFGLQKIRMGIYFTSRYSMDAPFMNWGWKAKGFGLISLVFLLSAWRKGIPRRERRWQLFVFAMGWGAIFVISVVVKMEDRIFFPLAFFILTMQWLRTGKPMPIWPKRKLRVLMILAFLFAAFVFVQNSDQADYIRRNTAAKQKIVEEINESFRGKTILFDNLSPYMLQTDPLETVQLTDSNEYLIALHYARLNFHSLEHVFDEDCPDASYRGVIECLKDNKEKYVFAYNHYSIDLMERWNRAFYGDTLKFREILPGSELSRNINCYLWNNQRYGYYVLE